MDPPQNFQFQFSTGKRGKSPKCRFFLVALKVAFFVCIFFLRGGGVQSFFLNRFWVFVGV